MLPKHLSETSLDDEGVSMIQEWVPKARCELAQYDKEIDRLHSLLGKIEGFRNNLQRYIDHSFALISPIRSLPTEVLSEIFTLSCIEDTEENFNIEAPDRSLMHPAGRTALRLSLVSSRWRSVALSTPKMWSFINVSIYRHSELWPVIAAANCEEWGSLAAKACVESHPVRHVVQLYLERSSNHPLSVTMSCPSVSRPNLNAYSTPFSSTETLCDVFLHEVFQVLSIASRRWRIARINLAHGPQRYGHRSCNLEAPLLEVMDIFPGFLSVSFSNTSRYHTPPHFMTSQWGYRSDKALFNAPALRSLTLHDFELSGVQKVLTALPSGRGVDVRIENFHLTRVGFGDATHGVYEAPEVRSLSVYIDEFKTGPSVHKDLYTSLTAKNVTKMEFVYRSMKHEVNDQWIQGLGARLKDREFPRVAVITMIERSAMPLRVLKIEGFIISDQELVKVLRLVQTVEVLSVAEGRLESEKARVEDVGSGDRGSHDNWDDEVITTEQLETYERWSTQEATITSKLLRRLTVSSLSISSDSEYAPLLPNLTSLSLTFRPDTQAQDLVNMVSSRWRGAASTSAYSQSGTEVLSVSSEYQSERRVAPLESLSVTLFFDDMLERRRSACLEEFEGGLRGLKDGGLDVRFGTIA